MNNPYDIIISGNPNATSFVELNEQYNRLYELLINNQRQISYLDLYKITEYISSEIDAVQIGSKFAQLNPNTAIGIGVPSIVFNGVTFYQGDLLLKLSNGQMQKLDAPSHGIYFPRWKEDETGKKLVWNYSQDEPTNESNSDPIVMTDDNNAELSLYWAIPDASSLNGYGQKISSTDFTEDATTKILSTTIVGVNGLVPIIKCFNQKNEEILADITITLPEDNTNYTVSNIPSCVSYLMVR